MADDERNEPDLTSAEAKRTGRERADPAEQPGEFLDDMHSNRFTPPPDPTESDER
jgi:hypothetical protein